MCAIGGLTSARDYSARRRAQLQARVEEIAAAVRNDNVGDEAIARASAMIAELAASYASSSASAPAPIPADLFPAVSAIAERATSSPHCVAPAFLALLSSAASSSGGLAAALSSQRLALRLCSRYRQLWLQELLELASAAVAERPLASATCLARSRIGISSGCPVATRRM